MKRFLVNFILGVSAVCAGADEIADISNADLKIADNVRIELHRQMDTSALLKALQNEKPRAAKTSCTAQLLSVLEILPDFRSRNERHHGMSFARSRPRSRASRRLCRLLGF
jgi:hypothetical protein